MSLDHSFGGHYESSCSIHDLNILIDILFRCDTILFYSMLMHMKSAESCGSNKCKFYHFHANMLLCILMFATFSAITSICEGEKGALCVYSHLLSRESRFTIE